MTERAHRFVAANRDSPVVYGGVDTGAAQSVTYRLGDNRVFRLSAEEARHVGTPRWAHQ